MKMKLYLFFIALVVLTTNSKGQFTFSISPGIDINGTNLGYKIKSKIVPWIGFQYMKAKLLYGESGERYDWEFSKVVSYSEENEFSGSLFISTLGLKYFIREEEKLKAYISTSFSKPFIGGKVINDGEKNEDVMEFIRKVGIFGGTIGFGAEYFIDENFSLGGEFGLRYLHFRYEDSYSTEFYNPAQGYYQETEIMNDLKFNISPTYSKISLNFYF